MSNNCDFDLFWDRRINIVPWDASLSYHSLCTLLFQIYQVYESTECLFHFIDYDEFSDKTMLASVKNYRILPFYSQLIQRLSIDTVIDFHQDVPLYLSLLVLFFLKLHELDIAVFYFFFLVSVDPISLTCKTMCNFFLTHYFLVA